MIARVVLTNEREERVWDTTFAAEMKWSGKKDNAAHHADRAVKAYREARAEGFGNRAEEAINRERYVTP